MAFSLFNNGQKKRDQMVAVDLGGRTTKAVTVQRKSDGLHLTRFALLDAPVYEKGLSAELAGEHLKSVVQTLNAGVRHLTLALGVTDTTVREAEMPPIPVTDMRQVLKTNAKNYLQQELPGHLFDCHILPPKTVAKPGESQKPVSPVGSQKFRVLVGAAKSKLVEDLQAAAKGAGLSPDQIVPGLIGPVNAFEMALPQPFRQDVVALVDVGFRNTTICVLQQGDLVLSRVVAIGGDKITAAEAEGIKIGMPQEVRSQLEGLITPLGRELRASLDFFEHQHDKVVSQVYLSGGVARSPIFPEILQTELLAPCKIWNPLESVRLSLPPQQLAEVEQVAPQLTVAIGTAIAALS
jgi:type IV pilus assembly protein PilM